MRPGMTTPPLPPSWQALRPEFDAPYMRDLDAFLEAERAAGARIFPDDADRFRALELTPLDQAMLSFETNQVASALKELTGATKINVGALGNIVRQLHVHIIARTAGDPCWPGPIWGQGTPEPYSDNDRHDFMKKLAGAL